MKLISLSFYLSLIAFSGFAQSMSPNQKAVANMVEAINTKSMDRVKGNLAPDFTISGQKGAIAIAILEQIIVQLNDQVLNSVKAAEQKTPTGTEVRYTFSYEKLGEKETIFLFNDSGMIKEFTPFEMEVRNE